MAIIATHGSRQHEGDQRCDLHIGDTGAP